MEYIVFEQGILNSIIETLSSEEQEKIGIFAGVNGHVSLFQMDLMGSRNGKNCCYLTSSSLEVAATWSVKESVTLFGVVHSHPSGFSNLSASDIAYARRLCAINNWESLLMAVVENHRLLLYSVIESDGTVIKKSYIVKATS